MKKSKKKKSSSIVHTTRTFLILFTILFFLITGMIIYTYQKPPTQTSQQSSSTACSTTKQIAELVKNAIVTSNEVVLNQPGGSPSVDERYTWKHAETEPYRTYPTAESGYLLHYYGQPVQETDRLFKEQAYEQIRSLGYVPNEVNTDPVEQVDETIEITAGQYGFTKGNERLVVGVRNESYMVVDNTMVNVPENSSVISFVCGQPNEDLDEIYTPIIENSDSFSNYDTLAIWGSEKDKVYLNVSRVAGHAECWIKEESTWRKAYQGHEPDTDPNCPDAY